MVCSRAAHYLRQRMLFLGLPITKKRRNARFHLPLLMERERQCDAPKPSCFGREFAVGHNAVCDACPWQVSCLHRCAHVRLPIAQNEIGSHIAQRIAEHTGWSRETVQTMQHLCQITGSIQACQVNAAPSQRTVPSVPSKIWPRRFMRERRRMPELSYLPPGTKLVRQHGGQTHIVTMLEGSYFYGGEYYPTLYAVAAAITGYKDHREHHLPKYRRRMGNYSARKFFGHSIEKAMPT